MILGKTTEKTVMLQAEMIHIGANYLRGYCPRTDTSPEMGREFYDQAIYLEAIGLNEILFHPHATRQAIEEKLRRLRYIYLTSLCVKHQQARVLTVVSDCRTHAAHSFDKHDGVGYLHHIITTCAYDSEHLALLSDHNLDPAKSMEDAVEKYRLGDFELSKNPWDKIIHRYGFVNEHTMSATHVVQKLKKLKTSDMYYAQYY